MILTPGDGGGRGDDARRIREALASMGAEGLCGALGLLDPQERRGWARVHDGVMVRCPVHSERTPSCHVSSNARDLVWYCHGCTASGGALDLVAAVQGIDARTAFRPPMDENAKRAFRELLDTGARVAGVADTCGTYTPRAAPPRAAPRPTEPRAEPLDVDVFARLADVILTDPLTALDRHPEPTDERECCACGCVDVRRYLEDRGVLELAMRDGWRSLPTLASERSALVARIVAAVGMEAWRASGLRYRDAEFKRVHHRVMIPWRDHTGRVTALQRRLLLAIPFEPECPACDRGKRCATYPHRRFITDPCDPRLDALPASITDAVLRSGKYEDAGKVLAPYGAHRLNDATTAAWPLVFVEGAVDALAHEALTRRDPDSEPRVLPLGIHGRAWSPEWGAVARGRHAVVALDDDAKETAQKITNHTRRTLKKDIAAHAVSVRVWLPRFDGERVKDWSDVLEMWNR